MLHLELPAPVFIDTQLSALANEAHSAKELMSLMQGNTRLIRNDDGNFSLENCTKSTGKNTSTFIWEAKGRTYLYGVDAILHYFPDAKPLNCVDIPVEVLGACTPMEWYDICISYRIILTRVSRLKKLIDLNAPIVIILNETRMVMEGIMALEHNNSYFGAVHVYDGDRIRRSLNDVGYSLLTGWGNKFDEESNEYGEEGGEDGGES